MQYPLAADCIRGRRLRDLEIAATVLGGLAFVSRGDGPQAESTTGPHPAGSHPLTEGCVLAYLIEGEGLV